MKILWIILFMIPALMEQEQKQQQSTVNVHHVQKSDKLQIFAVNENLYPVTVEIDFELDNLDTFHNLPYTGVLDPATNDYLMDFDIVDYTKHWEYDVTLKYYVGSIHASHNDNYVYRLPFKRGEEYKLSQGFNGSFSHNGDLKYALDFNMEVGTEVYAAREGVVVAIEENNDKGGPHKKYDAFSNYITVLHDDGTFADYSHLKKNGALVDIGDRVEVGELIGYSGDTGFASGPHLHFVVKKTKRGGGFSSVPVKFHTKDGVIELEEGKSYTGY